MNYSQIINDKMNYDIKKRYAAILKQDFNIVREQEAKIVNLKAEQANFSIRKMIAAAMILLLVTGALFLNADSSTEDPKDLIQQYLADHDMGLGTTRTTDTSLMNGAEEKFYAALDLLINEKYGEAVKVFQICADEIKKGEPFYHETNVYLINSLVMNNQNKLAKSLFDKLPETSWERGQLQQIFLNIE